MALFKLTLSFKDILLNMNSCNIIEDFEYFLKDELFCDMEFIVGPDEKKIMAHMAFVAARSQYFKNILQEHAYLKLQKEKFLASEDNFINTPKSKLKIRIQEANPEAFQMIIFYIYTGRLPLIKNILNLIDVCELADLYSMPILKNICLNYIKVEIKKTNVLDALCYVNEKRRGNEKSFPSIQIIRDICVSFIKIDGKAWMEDLDFEMKPCTILNENNVYTNKESFESFYGSSGKDFYDITFHVNGHIVFAHKSILAARSAYFREKLSLLIKPSNTIIKVSQIYIDDKFSSVETFRSLLSYIYYGGNTLPAVGALYILEALDVFDIFHSNLNQICRTALVKNITAENVLEILEVSDRLVFINIKEEALKKIVAQLPDIVSLPKFRNLSRDLLLDVIDAVVKV